MKLTTKSFAEHRTAGHQEVFFNRTAGASILVPGASSCCVGSSSTSCAATITPAAR